jgi:hypothetical protein
MSAYLYSPAEVQARNARDAARRKAAQEVEDRAVAKLEADLDRLEASLRVDPPPELSPSEKRERETVERLDRLEGKERILDPNSRVPASVWSRGNHLKTELRIRLIERERKGTEAREQADGTVARRDEYDAAKCALELAHNERWREAGEACTAARDASQERRDTEIEELGVRP